MSMKHLQVLLPTGDLDCTLEEYIEIICGMLKQTTRLNYIVVILFFFPAVLDIPVYKSYVQSLHVIFSLYLNFKKHQV
jgi:intraflagellar transport protein 46